MLLIVCTYVLRFDLEKKNHEILATLQYKPLYNISRSEKWGKKIQAVAYNGTRTVSKVLEIFTACVLIPQMLRQSTNK